MLHQLSAQDAQFLYIQTPNNLTHVMAIYVYDPATAPGGTVRFKDIIAHVRSRLTISPVFRRKLYRLPMDFDLPYWVEDESFDLESHISHGKLPAPGDWRQFTIHVARHFSKPMDMDRPLWDMYVVEGLDRVEGYAPGSYAILTRVHHAAIDGMSAAHFFMALSDLSPGGNPVFPVPEALPECGDVPSPTEIWERAVMSNMTSPVKLMNSFARFTPALLDMAQKNLRKEEREQSEFSVPDTRFNGAVGPYKAFEGISFALADLKAIKDKVPGATVNDAVISICSGALRHYLKKHKELPEKSLIAVAPINARREGQGGQDPGNNISAMTVRIHSDIADPLDRLAAVRDTTKDTKAAKTGIGARLMTDLTQHIPGATMAGVARLVTNERFAPKMSNLIISNVPGPQMPMYMAGAQLTHQYGMAPLGNGMGLFITTPSYNGTMSFGVTTDREIMPDLAFFRECIAKSFANHLAATPKPPKKSAQPAQNADKAAGKARSTRVKEINP
jgi:WS/DGAT/MGAT family acyltransferase